MFENSDILRHVTGFGNQTLPEYGILGQLKGPMLNKALSRRERQILDAIFRLGKATAAQIREALTDPPSYTAVRTHLTNLAEKGAVSVSTDGVRYFYEPTAAKSDVGTETLETVVQTFFDGRLDLVVNALIPKLDPRANKKELDAIAEMIKQARKEGK